MDREERERTAAVLEALADLSPPMAAPGSSPYAVPTEHFRWLPLTALALFRPHASETTSGRILTLTSPPPQPTQLIDAALARRLASIDQVRGGGPSIRLGWLFVAGRHQDEQGRAVDLLHPLVTVPVRVVRSASLLNTLTANAPDLPAVAVGRSLVAAGDAELTPFVTDEDARRRLSRRIDAGPGVYLFERSEAIDAFALRTHPEISQFARQVAAAAGFPAREVVGAQEGPDVFRSEPGLRIVAGVGVFALQGSPTLNRAGSLRSWERARNRTWTAFHSLYLPERVPSDEDRAGSSPSRFQPAETAQAIGDVDATSPFVLDPAQCRAVAASRLPGVSVVAGAPGTGKSHTIIAIAADAVAGGRSVLVAAKTVATVDALIELLERAPGPDPVVFGSTDRRRELAERLTGVAERAVTATTRDAQHRTWERAEASRVEWHDAVRCCLTELGDSHGDGGAHGVEVDARAAAPRLFLPGTTTIEVERVREACRRAVEPTSTSGLGWFTKRRRRAAARRARRLSGAASDLAIDALAMYAATARWCVEPRFSDLGEGFDQLAGATAEARRARARWLESESLAADRLLGGRGGEVARLAAALRSGRAARQDLLASIDAHDLTRALPLWVGTLDDIDELLPRTAAAFDLVILDEASSIDQPLAATALLRGRSAVIVGDPRQLRHVSFASDARHREVMACHGLDTVPDLAARLDVRRNSAFDLAAGAAPVVTLDEQHRSDPHLFEYVAQRRYGGKVHLATRTPRTEGRDCIELVRLEGTRDGDGVVALEVERVIEEVRNRVPATGSGKAAPRTGATGVSGLASVGIVTPFRAQADAIEAAVLAAFSVETLEALDLRVGTAHAFQGNERDVVIISFGVGPCDERAWAFVNDPHLFAVLVTRARLHQVLLVSGEPPPGSLVAGYLAQADAPPGRPRPVAPVSSWATALASDLAAAGLPTTSAYPSGRHVLDLVVDDPERAVGLITDLHPDGPEAHIERHLALRRQGWGLHHALEPVEPGGRGALVVDLLARLR